MGKTGCVLGAGEDENGCRQGQTDAKSRCLNQCEHHNHTTHVKRKPAETQCFCRFCGRGRRTRTLGTRFWSGCGRTQPGAGKSRCCPVPAASWREGGAGLVLRGNFSHFREEAHRYLKLVLVFFRLNEYNILGLMYASIVIMRCRK